MQILRPEVAAGDTALAFRRVVVGYRVVAAVWAVILGVITLVGQQEPDRPALVVLSLTVIVAWSTVTATVAARRPAWLLSRTWVLVDIALGVLLLLTPRWAGSSNYLGGYPLSVVFLAVYGRGVLAGLGAAIAMSANTIIGIVEEGSTDATSEVAVVLINVFGALLSAWAAEVIRQTARRRRQAEEALALERAERARVEERAEMAAHLHDSVLQTLALIQRSADDPTEVSALVRRQERELRTWLYGTDTAAPASLASAVKEVCAEVEDLLRVKVDLVTVGDRELDDPLRALAQAGREAIVNAAKHSGADRVSVFLEAKPEAVTLFVRDRGSGFDRGTVPADRRGIASSIEERMRRHGGTARIRTDPGKGTEVELVMRQ